MAERLIEGLDVINSREARQVVPNPSCFPQLSLTERLIAFGILNGLGFILQFGALARFMKAILTNDTEHFALTYSAGNVMSIVGILFLDSFAMCEIPCRRTRNACECSGGACRS